MAETAPLPDWWESMPKKVKVGHRTYEVIAWNLHLANHDSRFGEFDHTMREIRIRYDVDRNKVAETLLHEINHAIWTHYSIANAIDPADRERKVNQIEEDVVVSITRGQAAVLVDNPGLFAWIERALSSV